MIQIRISILLACYFSFLLLVNAQRTIDFSKSSIPFQSKEFQINQVIDARKDTLGIGVIHSSNKVVLVDSKIPLKSSILNLIQNYNRHTQKKKRELTLRLNKFFFFEIPNTDVELGFYEFSLTFIEKRDSEYVELYTVGKTIQRKYYLPITVKQHREAMTEGLMDCLQEFLMKMRSGEIKERLIDKEKLREVSLPSFELRYPKGVFYSFSDFVDRKVDTTLSNLNFELIKDKKFKEPIEAFKIKWKPELNRNREIWAVSDGNQVFKHIRGRYFPITKSQDSLILIGPRREKKAQSNSSYGGFLSGIGIVVGAFSVSYTGSGGKSHATEKREAKRDATRYFIDPLSGSLYLAQKSKYNFEVTNFKDLESQYSTLVTFIGSPYTKKILIIRIDGEELCSVPGGSVFTRRLSEPFKSYNLEVEMEGEISTMSFKIKDTKSEVVLLKNKKGTPSIKFVSEDLKTKMLRDKKNGRFKSSCSE